jgi:hypothetical protein
LKLINGIGNAVAPWQHVKGFLIGKIGSPLGHYLGRFIPVGARIVNCEPLHLCPNVTARRQEVVRTNKSDNKN